MLNSNQTVFGGPTPRITAHHRFEGNLRTVDALMLLRPGGRLNAALQLVEWETPKPKLPVRVDWGTVEVEQPRKLVFTISFTDAHEADYRQYCALASALGSFTVIV